MNDIETKILELWNQGISTSKIGAEIGRTKNSICGLIWRMRRRGLIVPERQKFKSLNVVRVKQNKKHEIFNEFNKSIVPEFQKIKFWSLKPNSCRYVINDGKPEQFIFCGNPKQYKSYCLYHANICYIPNERKKTKTQNSNLNK